ncbi:amino acid transporter [Massarina eburnea CBS 473.64]|uniref:Amino acid transporter n=1 Tax=Massarina eburnea CBS 473.64 TaxID=1395130 RepID=A0A6A6SBJ5_9PLEO|nr:amino acid transporter [Massarina eburnea CBS 473.64]
MASSETAPLLRDPDLVTPDQDHGAQTHSRRDSPPRGTFARQLSALDGFVLLISIVIGSGVFSSPGPVDANVPSPGAALLVWLLGGILAWTGALTMAELGTAFPGEGGIQPYLSYMYGEVFGYMAAWSWIVATMPATLAILSIVFVESIYSSLGINEPDPPLTHKLLSVLVLVAVSTANSISTKTSTRLGGFFVAVKFLTIALLGVAGLVVVFVWLGSGKSKDLGGGDWKEKNWFGARGTTGAGGGREWGSVGAWESLGFYSTALYGALWAYSGWDKANYVAAELRHPRTQLPLSINTALPTIITCYIAANTVYYLLLPWDTVSSTDAAAVTAISHFIGKVPAYLATALICLVILGSALGNSFVAGRMTVAAANKRWIPSIFATVGQVGTYKISSPSTLTSPNPSSPSTSRSSSSSIVTASPILDNTNTNKDSSPINALLLNTILSTLYILLGNMRILLTLNGLAEYAFFFLTVVGAILLRWRQPGLERPVKPLLIIPLLFAVISGFVVVRGAVFAPVQALVLVAVWGVGVVWFYGRGWVVRGRGRGRGVRG